MSVIPDSHIDLLERPLFAHFATGREDGWPQVNPMWFVWDGTHLKLTGTDIPVQAQEHHTRPEGRPLHNRG